jgi:hypothetical protein
MERYARQTRNATVFMAWLIGVLAALSLIGSIITAVEIAHLSNAINGGSSSNCFTQGGTDTSC